MTNRDKNRLFNREVLNLFAESVLLGPGATCVRDIKGALFTPATAVAKDVTEVDASGKVISVMDGYTNTVSPDLTSWTKGAAAASLTVTPLANEEYDVAYDGVATATLTWTIPLLALDRTGICNLRKTAGTTPISTDTYFGFSDAGGNAMGDVFELSEILDNFANAIPKVTTAHTTLQLRFRFDSSDGPVTIRVRMMRAVDSDVAVAQAPPGSPAGYVTEPDLLNESVDYGDSGTFMMTFVPEGWGGAGNPTSSGFARYFEMPGIAAFTGAGDTSLNITACAPITSGVAAVDGEPLTMTMDFNGVEFGFRVNDSGRSTEACAVIPSGDITLGNAPAGNRASHGRFVARYYKNTVLNPDQVKIARAEQEREIAIPATY